MQMLLCLLFSVSLVNAQPQQKIVSIRIAPDRAEWTYNVGEMPVFQIDVQKSNVNLQNVKISYEYGKETLSPVKKETLILKDGSLRIRLNPLTEPGFLRLKVQTEIDGKTYEEYCTAAFEPEKIRQTVEMPADFDAFWQKALEENAQIPLEPIMELQPDRSTDKVDVYHVSFQSYRKGSRIYGWLAMPKTAGKYPALVLGGYYPALCDLTGYLHNRAGGWPHVFKGADPLRPETMIKKKLTAYYDAVNFARNIRVPAFYTWGYNDLTCPPTSYYSAYNEIKAEKQVMVVPETGHWTYPEQRAALEQFVIGRLSL